MKIIDKIQIINNYTELIELIGLLNFDEINPKLLNQSLPI